eukprot:m51a1_g3615 hypothetical protein (294) ;mRNA; f:64092-65687
MSQSTRAAPPLAQAAQHAPRLLLSFGALNHTNRRFQPLELLVPRSWRLARGLAPSDVVAAAAAATLQRRRSSSSSSSSTTSSAWSPEAGAVAETPRAEAVECGRCVGMLSVLPLERGGSARGSASGRAAAAASCCSLSADGALERFCFRMRARCSVSSFSVNCAPTRRDASPLAAETSADTTELSVATRSTSRQSGGSPEAQHSGALVEPQQQLLRLARTMPMRMVVVVKEYKLLSDPGVFRELAVVVIVFETEWAMANTEELSRALQQVDGNLHPGCFPRVLLLSRTCTLLL